jgi:hypothetical protein
MRNPQKKAAYSAAATLFAAAGLWLAITQFDRLGQVAGTLIGIISMTVALFGFGFLVLSLFAAVGYARLTSGEGEIARWRVSPAEWERFRAFDAVRGAEQHWLANEFKIQALTPAVGVEVIVGRRQIIVDGSYHVVSGTTKLHSVLWHSAPVDPECLEFGLLHSKGEGGGTLHLSLRVPVPAVSRDAGVRVYWHYHALLPKPPQRLGLVFRRPRLVFGSCFAVTLIAAAVGSAAAFMMSKGNHSELVVVLAVAGIGTAIGALLVAALLALIVWSSRSK